MPELVQQFCAKKWLWEDQFSWRKSLPMLIISNFCAELRHQFWQIYFSICSSRFEKPRQMIIRKSALLSFERNSNSLKLPLCIGKLVSFKHSFRYLCRYTVVFKSDFTLFLISYVYCIIWIPQMCAIMFLQMKNIYYRNKFHLGFDYNISFILLR